MRILIVQINVDLAWLWARLLERLGGSVQHV
jgi:hypothetical protein